MSQHDVSGLLMTYSERARKTHSAEKFHEAVRELKRELSAQEIKKMKIG